MEVFKVKWGKPKKVGEVRYNFKKNPLNKLKLKNQKVILVDSDKWTFETPINKMVA